MRIYITSKQIIANKDVIVQFESELGNGIGQWKGKPLEPEIHSWYFVELKVGETEFVWGMNIIESSERVEKLDIESNNLMVIQGKIEVIDNKENYCLLRLGNSLFSLGTATIPRQIGDYIQVKSKKLLLFNENL